MELLLIRHAQSQNNALPESQRVPDPPLTSSGFEQADRLAHRLADESLTRLITSPFLRTLQTSESIRRTTELQPCVRTELHEQGGCYHGVELSARIGQPGLTRHEISRQFPHFEVESPKDELGWWQSRPFEESDQAQRRAEKLLEATVSEFATTSERVAYVMHADIKVLFLKCFHLQRLAMPFNSSVTRLVITPEKLEVVKYNCVDHLPNHLVTM